MFRLIAFLSLLPLTGLYSGGAVCCVPASDVQTVEAEKISVTLTGQAADTCCYDSVAGLPLKGNQAICCSSGCHCCDGSSSALQGYNAVAPKIERNEAKSAGKVIKVLSAQTFTPPPKQPSGFARLEVTSLPVGQRIAILQTRLL